MVSSAKLLRIMQGIRKIYKSTGLEIFRLSIRPYFILIVKNRSEIVDLNNDWARLKCT
jgi:hypothetical protein